MSIAVPLYGFGASGGTGGTLTVTAPANVTVTVSKDGKTKTKNSGTSGVVVFKGLTSGTWTVTITGDGKTAQKNVVITTDYSTAISFNTIPEFTYTGDYEIVNDSDEPITVSQGNWKIRFLTSGTLTFTNLNGAEGGIDVFLVGGGGSRATSGVDWNMPGGGGGGYTKTMKNIQVTAGSEYSIVVGAKGATGQNAGGNTTAFGSTANGGQPGQSDGKGGNGGSGGGGGAHQNHNGVDAGSWGSAANGGTDGSNGSNSPYAGGTGQGTTTREFGETAGKRYAAGGGGISGNTALNGAMGTVDVPLENSGTAGYSGIAIIRNARGAT